MYDMVESIVGKMMLLSLSYTKMELKTKSITIQPVCICGGPPIAVFPRVVVRGRPLVVGI